MLTSEDKALWDTFSKTVTPLGKVSKFKELGQRITSRFKFRHPETMILPTTLDLHGFTLAEAHKIFLLFLNKHAELGTKSIIVITGRGKEGSGLLKSEFPLWLENPSVKGIIKSNNAPERQGGGAFEIMLKQRKN